MNKTSVSCHIAEVAFSYFNSRQLVTLVVINLLLMVGNVIANALVIYILIKTKQSVNVTCKLIFALSTSDLLIGVIGQNLFAALFFHKNCFLQAAFRSLSMFLIHLSGYTTGIIGIDRYVRIKHYASFKTLWTKRIVLSLLCAALFFALFQVLLVEIALKFRKEKFAVPINAAIDSVLIEIVVFLQVKTIRTSNTVTDNSSLVHAQRINKVITKLSMRIMLLLCMFLTPYTILTSLLRASIKDQLNGNDRSILEFVYCMNIIHLFGNSFANAVLFLMTIVKAKRFLRELLK